MHFNEGLVFCRENPYGVLRRWYSPAPSKYLAAEALLRGKPEWKREELKAKLGFDVFEDVPEEKGEDDVPIVYW